MDWRALEARIDSRLVRAFGETVRLSFMKDGLADPGRPQMIVRGILHTEGSDSIMVGEKASGIHRTRLSAGQAELILNRSQYIGPMPKGGDKVRGLDRAGSPGWEVAGVSDRYSNLIVLSLTQI